MLVDNVRGHRRIIDSEDETTDLDAKDARIADLEDRLATVEAELGIDATASHQGVADD